MLADMLKTLGFTCVFSWGLFGVYPRASRCLHMSVKVRNTVRLTQ